MELPRYQLRDANERAALRCLIPTWGDRKHNREFQEIVLAYLALIGKKYSGSDRRKPERSAHKLRRDAIKIQNFVRWLKSSMPKELIGVPPSTSELLQYADHLAVHSGLRNDLGTYALYDTASAHLIEKLAEPSDERQLPQWAKSQTEIQDESVPMSGALTLERTKWIAKVLRQISNIKPGMRRRDLLAVC